MDQLPRVSTGSPELDLILGGGFPTASINIVMGEPGSGKTVLAEHLVFANARDDDRPIVYLTTLSEPLEKIVRYLQQFEFYDEAKLLGSVRYDSVGATLVEHGLAGLLAKLRDLIETVGPKIIVIDSFKAIHDLSASEPEMRRMLHEMAGLLGAYDTTAFLLGEYDAKHFATLPEFAVVDGIIELTRSKSSTRDERYLRVLKLRGSSYIEGQHNFSISVAGLHVFPRLVSPSDPPSYQPSMSLAPTGLPGLDQMLGGGVWSGSTTMVVGPTGSGKTTMGLQFALAGVRRGEPALYINFQENPTQLIRHLRTLGASEAEIAAFDFLYVSPVELQIDSILVTAFRTVTERGIQRLVIDSLGDLEHAAVDLHRLQNYLYALIQHLAVRGVSSLMTMEIPTTLLSERRETSRLSAFCDVLVVLDVEYGEEPYRTVRVVKARGHDHVLEARQLLVGADGLRVQP